MSDPNITATFSCPSKGSDINSAQKRLSTYSSSSHESNHQNHEQNNRKLPEQENSQKTFLLASTTLANSIWSYIPSFASSVKDALIQPILDSLPGSDANADPPQPVLKSVPLKSLSKVKPTTGIITSVAVLRGDDSKSELINHDHYSKTTQSDKDLSSKQDGALVDYRPLSPPSPVDSDTDSDSVEYQTEEAYTPFRRFVAKHKLQSSVSGDLLNYLPNLSSAYESSTSSSGPGFVQQLVIQALLSPTSRATAEGRNMGYKLYSLMTGPGRSILNGGNDDNLLATRFREKSEFYPDEDLQLISTTSPGDPLLLELKPIKKGFVPTSSDIREPPQSQRPLYQTNSDW